MHAMRTNDARLKYQEFKLIPTKCPAFTVTIDNVHTKYAFVYIRAIRENVVNI